MGRVARVLLLDGRIVLGEETIALRERVKNLPAEGKKNFVLDLRDVSFIDSADLGALVRRLFKREIGSSGVKTMQYRIKVRRIVAGHTTVHGFRDIFDSDADAVRAAATKLSAD